MKTKINQLISQIKAFFQKYYANKKIFWATVIPVGVILLVIILGLLFGNRKNNKLNIATPTPQSQNQEAGQQNSQNLDPLINIENNLNKIKGKINDLDIKQLPLAPPIINYRIDF